MKRKACPVIFRVRNGATDLLAFKHPSAGKQFVKGSIEDGESPGAAAIRELQDESGLTINCRMQDLGEAQIGLTIWHFFAAEMGDAPEEWVHQTADDCGHVFEFFWHPIADDLNEEWHSDFHQAFKVIREALPGR